MRLRKRFIALLAAAAAAAPAIAGIPEHPDQIAFPPLQFTPPAAADFRHTISTSAGEVPVYLAPSTEFPLISVTFTFNGGGDVAAPDRVGLASAMASMMRRGARRPSAPPKWMKSPTSSPPLRPRAPAAREPRHR